MSVIGEGLVTTRQQHRAALLGLIGALCYRVLYRDIMAEQ
jgi:predicted tellurium resistance membrane protein TerC